MSKKSGTKKMFSTREILWKSFQLGLKVKTPVSMLVSVLAIPAALLPLLLSRQLQRITDLLVAVAKGGTASQKALDSAGVVDNAGTVSLAVVSSALIVLAVLFLLQQLSMFLTEYYMICDKHRTWLYIKEFVLKQVCNVQYSYIENRDDFIKRIEFADTYVVQEMCRNVQSIFSVLQQSVTFISISIALWAVHPALVIIVVVTAIPAAILSYKQSDDTFRHRAKWSEEGHLAIFYFHLCSSYSKGMQEVRHYELFDYLKARWRAIADNYIYKKKQLTAKHLKVNLWADLFRSGVYLVILFLTAWELYQNPLLGVGIFTLVYTLSDKLQKATGNIFTQIMWFSTSLVYLQEFFSLEKLEMEDADDTGKAPVAERKFITGLAGANEVDVKENAAAEGMQRAIMSEKGGKISFYKVSFSYPESDREVLHDITVSINPGEKIAIVGDNGSGKSTFISLLTGLFAPQKGDIEIDGRKMKDHKQKLRNQISVVFQDFAHYEASLRENITVSDEKRNLSDEELVKLAREAKVEDVIEEQAEGFGSLLGRLSQKGNDLSGGQWQKIALLRALYRNNTNIMILDEPTAALDPLAEAELYRNFSQITGDRTTLLISHRLGITKLVDRILVFRDGRIVEDGTHQELMQKKAHYYEMYQAQAAWYQT